MACCAPTQETGPVVLAASSMQEGLVNAGQHWAQEGHLAPVFSFAASSAVARQVSEGAPADIVVTSDKRWMDWLAERGALASDPRELVSNTLVVVAPAAPAISAAAPGTLAALAADPGGGRLAIAEPDSVPAGQFARAALESMGIWGALSDRLVPGENVRAALAMVERGEAALGIVYASDARASERVRVVERIDTAMHPPILYYAALVADARHPQALVFLDFIASDAGRGIIAEQGFIVP